MDGTCTTADAMTDQPETMPTNPEETPATESARKRSTNGRSRKASRKRGKRSSPAKQKAAQTDTPEEGTPVEDAEPDKTNEPAESVSPETDEMEVPTDEQPEDEAQPASSEPTSEPEDANAAGMSDEMPEAMGDDVATAEDASEVPAEPVSETANETESASLEETTETTSSTDTADIEIHPHRVTEAILFCTDSPLPAAKIAKILGVGTAKDVKKHIGWLNEEYTDRGMSFRVEEVAGGFQMLTIPAYNTWLSRVVKTRQETKLSPAAMETLSIVAYKQPCTRADVEAIRGVAAGDMLNRLREMNLVKIVGRAEDLGRPLLYGTTRRFLEVFGLPSLEDLPTIEGIFAPAPVEAESPEETVADTLTEAPSETDAEPVTANQQPAEAAADDTADTQVESKAERPAETVQGLQEPVEDEGAANVVTPDLSDEEAPAEETANVPEVPVASVEAWPDAPCDEPVIESDAPPHLAIVGADDNDTEDEGEDEATEDAEETDENGHIVERSQSEDVQETTEQGEHTSPDSDESSDTPSDPHPRPE